jgi:hypothetical protein
MLVVCPCCRLANLAIVSNVPWAPLWIPIQQDPTVDRKASAAGIPPRYPIAGALIETVRITAGLVEMPFVGSHHNEPRLRSMGRTVFDDHGLIERMCYFVRVSPAAPFASVSITDMLLFRYERDHGCMQSRMPLRTSMYRPGACMGGREVSSVPL